MKVLILGASSYVGARLYVDLQDTHEVLGTYSTTHLMKEHIHLDITDADEVDRVITQAKPDLIIHAANNANGRWCEANPEEAKRLNEDSTNFILAAANKISAKLIYISSFAAINPNGVYGHTKLASEEITKQTKAGWLILRPSLIIGLSPNTTNDRPFNRLLKNIDEGTPAEYDTSWKFQPTWLGHISEVIALALERGVIDQIIPIAVPELKSRYDLAVDILKPFNVGVKPIDAGDRSAVFAEDLSMLDEFDLPSYSYQQIIANIIKEIQNRNL